MNSTLKKIVNFNHKNKWVFSLHITTLFLIFYYLIHILLYIFYSTENSFNYYYLSIFYGSFGLQVLQMLGLILISFSIFRIFTKYISTWKGYILLGLRISLVYLSFSILHLFIFPNPELAVLKIVEAILIVILSIILGIFFEKSSFKRKMKNLFSLILFVWALYKIYDNLVNGNKPKGIDADGDGILDSFDTDGDGNIDTVYQDLDGDGQFDSIAMDTDGDGIIDTVAGDTSGDGNIDTILSDTDGDGIADVRIKDKNGDGKIDGLS